MGGQKGIALFCKYLGKNNQLIAVSVEDNDASFAENYKIISLFTKKRRRYINPFYVFRISKIVKENNIQNVITEHPYMAWMGWYLKKIFGLKWFVHTHNIEFERFRTLNKNWYRFLKIYESWAYKNADKVFFKTTEDAEFAINNKMVKKENAVFVPFGIEVEKMPGDKAEQKNKICLQYNIPENTTLLFFNGTLNYQPNIDALVFILNELNPLLMQQKNFSYKILISGRDLPASFNELKSYADKNIIYAGFVDDVYAYFKAIDIFINPVITGGGIKTKIVEAIAYGETVISGKSGAAGIELSACGNKIKIVADNDVHAFVNEIIKIKNEYSETPAQYYGYYYWGNIVKKIQPLFKN